MAVAVNKARLEARTGLKMNAIFFGMSMVMLLVMGVSMWKDTHPEWRKYQEQYLALERNALIAQRDDLTRQINHPDYNGDYLKEKKRYEDAKGVFDKASSDLEDTEANLEEMNLKDRSAEPEEGAAEGASKPAAEGAKPAAAAAPASKDELAELDKEFKEAGGKSAPVAPPSPKPAKSGTKSAAPSKSAKPAVAGKDEMAELDQEFKEAEAKKPAGTAAPEKSSKEPAAKAGKAAPSNDEMAELDKEFKEAETKKPAGAPEPAAKTAPAAPAEKAAEPAAPAAAPELSFEEASFTLNEKGAEDQVESATRDLLTAQRLHSKELIALPKEEELKRKLAEAHLTEAQQTLAVATANLELEKRKADVKDAAQFALWARDAEELKTARGDTSPAGQEKVARLEESAKNLQAHVDTLKRDLRLVEGRLERNKSGGLEVQQVYVESLGRVDRCTTCHKGIEDHLFDTAAQPFKAHSGNMLKWHPVEKFGCASCHGGYGNALGVNEAHGELVGKGKPLLRGDQVQASCAKCHGDTKPMAGDSTLLAGAELFKNSGCLGCHKVETIASTLKAGPSLDRVDEKVNAGWLVEWLKNPRSHSLEARMPSFGLSQDEAQAIATYLLSQHGRQATAPPPIPEPSPEKLVAGKVLVDSLGCKGCHMIRGEGASVGPELTYIRYKARPDWLYSWLENPKAYLENSRMPVFGLTHEQAVLIGDYLLSVGKSKTPPPGYVPDARDSAIAQAGAKLIAERGCEGCHDIKGFEKIAAPELTHVGDKTADLLEFGNAAKVKRTLFDWITHKLQDPKSYDTDKFKARMPKFGLDEQESNAIAVYLLSLTSETPPQEYTKDIRDQDTPLIAGRRIVADHNCIACHRLAGEGGKVGPELTREGEKVQPAWLFKFLEHPTRIRWWQPARMPDFHLSQTEATTLTEYLMALSNQPAPYDYTPPEKLVFPLADVGAKHFIDLKCQSCHPFGGKQSAGGGDTKKLGPDLALASSRLKSDWMLRFFRDPQSIDPGTQMPTFKETDQTFKSMIDFLMKQKAP